MCESCELLLKLVLKRLCLLTLIVAFILGLMVRVHMPSITVRLQLVTLVLSRYGIFSSVRDRYLPKVKKNKNLVFLGLCLPKLNITSNGVQCPIYDLGHDTALKKCYQ